MIRSPNGTVPDRSAQVLAMVVTVATAVPTAWFSAAEFRASGGPLAGPAGEPARRYASYVAARNVVLLGAALSLGAGRAWSPLRLVLALNGCVQAVDALIGAGRHELGPTVGPVCFSASLFLAAARLRRTPVRRGLERG